jgi:hypothetical protein
MKAIMNYRSPNRDMETEFGIASLRSQRRLCGMHVPLRWANKALRLRKMTTRRKDESPKGIVPPAAKG